MSVLQEILSSARRRTEQRRQAVPLREVRAAAARRAPALDAAASLAAAHSGPNGPTAGIIAEVKRRSPSMGMLARIPDPAALATAYVEGGAVGVSVLTDADFFAGGLSDLRAVADCAAVREHGAFVLRKDFIVDEYQVWEARAAGADMLLLMAACLTDDRIADLLDLTHELGMHALVEAHDAAEVQRCVDVGARVIGINARDLRNLSVDRTRFADLVAPIPADRLVVAESGMRGPEDIAGAARAGAAAALVGTTLVQAYAAGRDVATLVAELREGGGAAPLPTRAVDPVRTAAMPQLPDALGHFGTYGGRFVPEALVPALDELTEAYAAAAADPAFRAEFHRLMRDYVGRPSPVTEARRFGDEFCGGARVLLKREDLNHTGSHKINNVIGQALLTVRMGKKRLIAETGAGQHGVATATAAALFGLECVVYMGEVDTERQALNVARMRLLGAEVVPVRTGSRTLKDAINEAMRDWVTNVDTTHYLLGTVAGPHPFPKMVRDFHGIIGVEARQQVREAIGRGPDTVVACVGGGSNAIGIFTAFRNDPEVALYGFEAGGDGVETGRHAATLTGGSVGVLHGTRSYLLQDDMGQTIESHSISAGLDYPGVGPEHAWLRDTGRATYEPVTDTEAMDAFAALCRTEGIIPAIESAHALAGAMRLGRRAAAAGQTPPVLLVSLSGRGDKDVETAVDWFAHHPAAGAPAAARDDAGESAHATA